MTMQEWLDSLKSRNPRQFAQLGQPEIVRYPKTSRYQIPQVEVKFPGVAQHLVFDMEIGAEKRATLREKERIYLKYNGEIARLRFQMKKEIERLRDQMKKEIAAVETSRKVRQQ